ncbi:MAG: hypothetical protein JXQ80_03040 [Bacteroidales bacterium]|nr:hypothetical protein [Bacteroidales bacterium]
MISIDIPGYGSLMAENLVLDYNGTLAIDGELIQGVTEMLNILSHKVVLHVLTADTFGNVATKLQGIPCNLKIIGSVNQDVEKDKYLKQLGAAKSIAIGNGVNDALMLKNAALGIAVMQNEGLSVKSLLNAQILCADINDALSLLLNPKRLAATLRN